MEGRCWGRKRERKGKRERKRKRERWSNLVGKREGEGRETFSDVSNCWQRFTVIVIVVVLEGLNATVENTIVKSIVIIDGEPGID